MIYLEGDGPGGELNLKVSNLARDNGQKIRNAFTDPEPGAPSGGKLMGQISLNFNLDGSPQDLPRWRRSWSAVVTVKTIMNMNESTEYNPGTYVGAGGSGGAYEEEYPGL